MTIAQQIITIAICAVATMLTRFLPFLVFSGKKQPPALVRFFGKALPPAVFALLVVYCLKDVSLTAFPFGLPELLAIFVTVALHLWQRKMLLSIAGGTVIYMLLVQLVF